MNASAAATSRTGSSLNPLDAWIASEDQHGRRVRRGWLSQDESLGMQSGDTHRACYFAGRDTAKGHICSCR